MTVMTACDHGTRDRSPDSDSAAGFTLVEVIVAMGISSVLVVGIGSFFSSSSGAYASVATRCHLTARAQVVMERLCQEIITGEFLSMDPPAALQSSSFRFNKVLGFDGTDPILGNPIQISFLPNESFPTNGLNDDGNGLVDEGSVFIFEDVPPTSVTPGPEDKQATIVANVARDGLKFTRSDGLMVIELTLQAVPDRGRDPVSLTLISAVRMRN